MFTSILTAENEASTTKRVLGSILIALTGSLFIALCSKVSMVTPFSPVPFTLQSHAVLLLAMVLGTRGAFYSVCAFLVQGAMGLPVFAHPLGLLGPTGGYLLSYLLVVPFVGWAFTTWGASSFVRRFSVLTIASAMILFCGMVWLSFWIGWQAAFVTGVLPFVITDLMKVVLLAGFNLSKE